MFILQVLFNKIADTLHTLTMNGLLTFWDKAIETCRSKKKVLMWDFDFSATRWNFKYSDRVETNTDGSGIRTNTFKRHLDIIKFKVYLPTTFLSKFVLSTSVTIWFYICWLELMYCTKLKLMILESYSLCCSLIILMKI